MVAKQRTILASLVTVRKQTDSEKWKTNRKWNKIVLQYAGFTNIHMNLELEGHTMWKNKFIFLYQYLFSVLNGSLSGLILPESGSTVVNTHLKNWIFRTCTCMYERGYIIYIFVNGVACIGMCFGISDGNQTRNFLIAGEML